MSASFEICDSRISRWECPFPGIFAGNPCHEEALEIAQTVGFDFMISATIDNRLSITGVFAGDLVEAHLAAFEAMKAFVRIPIQELYDIVLSHTGYVGRDHYQSVKAAVNAMPSVIQDSGTENPPSHTSRKVPMRSLWRYHKERISRHSFFHPPPMVFIEITFRNCFGNYRQTTARS